MTRPITRLTSNSTSIPENTPPSSSSSPQENLQEMLTIMRHLEQWLDDTDKRLDDLKLLQFQIHPLLSLIQLLMLSWQRNSVLLMVPLWSPLVIFPLQLLNYTSIPSKLLRLYRHSYHLLGPLVSSKKKAKTSMLVVSLSFLLMSP